MQMTCVLFVYLMVFANYANQISRICIVTLRLVLLHSNNVGDLYAVQRDCDDDM